MNTKYLSLVLLVAGLGFASCKKKGCTDPTADNYSEEAKKEDNSCTYSDKYGTVDVIFDHKWGMSGADFQMNTDIKHPMTGDTLNFSMFKYYVSNFRLKDTDGNWWSHPESYFLLDLSNGTSASATIENVPVGTYTEMSYMLGVDSARNVSGAQSGALSVTNGMFWSWTTGYIMIKTEGTSPQAGSGSFAFHLGGFEGSNNIVTTKTVDFSALNLEVKEGGNSDVYMIANCAKLWHSSPSVSTTPMIHMPGTGAVTMASDFYGGFALNYVQNN